MKNVNEVVVAPPTKRTCGICALVGHSTEECLTIPAFEEVLLEQFNVVFGYQKLYNNPYSETYNSGW